MSEAREIKDPNEFNRWCAQNDAVAIDSSGALALGYISGWLAPDGSYMANGSSFTNPALVPPPADPNALWKNRWNYAKAAMELAEIDFRNLKAKLLGDPMDVGWSLRWRKSYGEHVGENEQALRQIRDARDARRAEFEAIDNDPPEWVAEQRRRLAASQASKAEERAESDRQYRQSRSRIAGIN